MQFKKKTRTTSISLPIPWCERLDAIIAEGDKQSLNVTRSNIILKTLIKNHKVLQQVEKDLGMAPMSIDDLA